MVAKKRGTKGGSPKAGPNATPEPVPQLRQVMVTGTQSRIEEGLLHVVVTGVGIYSTAGGIQLRTESSMQVELVLAGKTTGELLKSVMDLLRD